MEVTDQGVQDLFGGFLPHERFRVVVPCLDPFADVVFQGLDTAVDSAADRLIGEEPEPPFDLVEPRRAGRGEMQVEAGVTGQPRLDRGGFVRAVVTPSRTPIPNVTVFDPSFEAPKAWRGSLGISRRLLDQRVNVSLDASFARGVSQTGANDLNLSPSPSFSLAMEAHRPVFVTAGSIDTATGAVPLSSSRRDPRFGFVNVVSSRLKNDTRQLTLGVNGFFTRRLIMLNTSYTYSRSRDQVLGATQGFGGSSVAGDPRVPDWGRSDQERRHSITGTIMWPFNPGLELSAIVRASSGARFTPIVGGDVNGDGARNDRAFIYYPATAFPSSATDTAIANGMVRLLEPRRNVRATASRRSSDASRRATPARRRGAPRSIFSSTSVPIAGDSTGASPSRCLPSTRSPGSTSCCTMTCADGGSRASPIGR